MAARRRRYDFFSRPVRRWWKQMAEINSPFTQQANGEGSEFSRERGFARPNPHSAPTLARKFRLLPECSPGRNAYQ